MSFFLNALFNGLGVGAFYALIAVGFVLIYKATKVLNFAQGSMVLMGAYFGLFFLSQLSLPIPLALFLTLGLTALMGLAINRTLIQPMIGQPIISIVMITIALAWVLNSLATAIWGTTVRMYPRFIPAGVIRMGEITASKEMIVSFMVAMLVLAILTFFFRTNQGLAMRTTAEDHQVARALGIPVRRIFGLTWVLAGVLCGVGGVLLAHMLGPIREISYIGLKALPAALIGGLDSLGGAIVAGLFIGLAENVAAGYLDPIMRGGTADIFTFILMFIVITIRPYGLFGLRKIERI